MSVFIRLVISPILGMVAGFLCACVGPVHRFCAHVLMGADDKHVFNLIFPSIGWLAMFLNVTSQPALSDSFLCTCTISSIRRSSSPDVTSGSFLCVALIFPFYGHLAMLASTIVRVTRYRELGIMEIIVES